MRALGAVMRMAGAEVLARRSALFTGIAVMVINDSVWLVFWRLFFGQVGTIRGWNVDDMMLLFAVVTTVVGLAIGFLDNSHRLGGIIASGDLDELLVLPMNPLTYILFRRISPINLGDLVFGVGLFLLSGNLTVMRFLIYAGASLTGAAVLASFLVLLGSLTFFIGGKGTQGDLGFHAVVALAAYPMDLFGGVTRILIFTAVPAAFVTGLERELISSFDWSTAALLGTVAAGLTLAATGVFQAGLRRYRSGATWKGVS